jgi:hypothetical protein
MVPLQKLKKAPPPPQVVWPYETGPEVFASQKLQGVFPNTSPKGGDLGGGNTSKNASLYT